ncbi:polysaccharide pyruvyl transferase family protein [Clostridium psychrophilum]|uniref:polysaccharide pyruvyl transferase family protein n=1 Tax=Clostridium psychrophilum TaxID=132926 RepID=UPI001C0BA429|nr:polysaccharide pyruvyl transferase family protein [Clostridium psychrophilum]MBU3180712.1 polysaccharide pyruvyl transferase family protein [Clostridium psychrophilum]
MKKILVIAFFAKNFGDDLFLKTLFERYNNIEWTMDVYDESYNDVFAKYKNVKIISTFCHKVFRKLKLEKLTYKKYDAVVFIGGSIFMEIENWRSTYTYRQKIFRFFDEKAIFFIGCNFGPYKSKEFIEKYKNLFGKCKDICFRDNYSYDLFKHLDNTRVAPDVVFQLKTKKIEKTKKTLGISVIDLSERKDLVEYQEKYINKVIDIIKEAINRQIKVTLFSFCEREGDMKIIEKITSNLEKKYIDYVNMENYDGRIERFLEKFKSMENIIGTRFHACILSQVFDQGIYPLIYSNKTYNALKEIDLVNEYTNIKDIDKLDEKHILNTISENKTKSNDVFSKAEEQFAVLDEYIR